MEFNRDALFFCSLQRVVCQLSAHTSCEDVLYISDKGNESMCKTRGLSLIRVGFILLLANYLLELVQEWMKGKLKLIDDGTSLFREKNLLQYLAVLLCSSRAALTMEKSIDIFKQFEAVSSFLERIRWVSANLLVFSITRRRTEGENSWVCQRDQTANLTEFEDTAFQDTRYFLNTAQIFLTLHDDSFATWALHSHLKSLSA